MAQETQTTANDLATEFLADAPRDERYSRQILFRGIGAEGQRKLATARVAIVGCGATGSALAGLLARAGVGTLRIIDRDYVEPSNLQRQSLFDEKDAAESLPKAIAAARKIAAFNSQIVVEPKVEDLVPANIEALLEGMSSDPRRHRQLRNSLPDQRLRRRPLASVDLFGRGGKLRRHAERSARTNRLSGLHLPGFAARHGRDLRNLRHSEFGGEPGGVDRRDRGAEVAGRWTLAAPQLRRTLLSFDVWTNEHAEISAAKPRPGCRACGERDFIHLAGEGRPHITLCGRNSVQIHERQRPIDFAEMDRRLQPHGTSATTTSS